MLPFDAQFPLKIKKLNNYTEEIMAGSGRASAISLMVYLSPATGEPLSMHVNHRESQMRSMNKTTVVDIVKDGQHVQEPVNFLDDLLQDKMMNSVVTPGSNPIHVFAAAVEATTLVPSDDDFATFQDNYLQTWMLVNYQTDNEIIPYQKVVLLSEMLRDVTVQDINQLHYLLNIPHFFEETTMPVGDGSQPIVFFSYIFDKLKLMPLHDSIQLRHFVHHDLGIPLFKNKGYMPLYEQWTQLSYFLQMCSPICLSPVEGGHRTLQMIKFFTGAEFNNKSPQPSVPKPREGHNVEVMPFHKINEFGLAMTTYNYSFWQRFDKTNHVGKETADELQLQSHWFQQVLNVSCNDTNDSFLVKVLQELGNLFDCDTPNQFTTTKFFWSHRECLDLLDARMQKAYPVILECLRTISPAKKQWDSLLDAQKKKYEAATPPKGSVPIFRNLLKSLVSASISLHNIH